MASISDLIMQQVKSVAGGVQIPSDIQNQVFNGLSSSILGSLTQTASKPGGVDLIKNLLTGRTQAAASPITVLAGSLFKNNVLKNLGVGSTLGTMLTGLIPKVLGGLSNIIKDQDGDGDVDLNDIILTLTGGGQRQQSAGASILGAATSILGGLFKK